MFLQKENKTPSFPQEGCWVTNDAQVQQEFTKFYFILVQHYFKGKGSLDFYHFPRSYTGTGDLGLLVYGFVCTRGPVYPSPGR